MLTPKSPLDKVCRTRLKGLNFRGFLAVLERLKGAESVAKTIDELPPEPQDALRYGRVVAGGWYPVAWYRELHKAMHRACRAGPELSRQIGHDATVQDFQGVYRFVISMLTTETVFGQAHRLFGMYWEGGKAETLEVRAGMGHVRFTGWDGFDRNIWEDVMGGCEGILSACGNQHVRRRILAGGGDGDDLLDLEFRWT